MGRQNADLMLKIYYIELRAAARGVVSFPDPSLEGRVRVWERDYERGCTKDGGSGCCNGGCPCWACGRPHVL